MNKIHINMIYTNQTIATVYWCPDHAWARSQLYWGSHRDSNGFKRAFYKVGFLFKFLMTFNYPFGMQRFNYRCMQIYFDGLSFLVVIWFFFNKWPDLETDNKAVICLLSPNPTILICLHLLNPLSIHLLVQCLIL